METVVKGNAGGVSNSTMKVDMLLNQEQLNGKCGSYDDNGEATISVAPGMCFSAQMERGTQLQTTEHPSWYSWH